MTHGFNGISAFYAGSSEGTWKENKWGAAQGNLRNPMSPEFNDRKDVRPTESKLYSNQ